jgi:tetratricopeptide (TPR) repeat protein
MRVPLVIVGPGVAPGASDPPVSARRVFHTVLDWAGVDPALSLRQADAEVVLGEAMKPFLAYGWQPQVMAIQGRHKAIRAGTTEIYDVVGDAAETRDLAGTVELPRPLRTALQDYPTPSLAPARPSDALGEEERRQLASLGYVGAAATPVLREGAPRPAAMVALFADLDEASTRFVRGEYGRVVPLLQRILKADPGNLDTALRLATAHSMLGRAREAEAAFEQARRLAPHSPDVRAYLALHLARGPRWEQAVPLLEQVVAESPDRVPALEALGELAMRQGRTALALGSFEEARRLQGNAFRHDLELGVLYLFARRYPEARDALDRVPPSHPGYPMALFKRAQASVLLREPDRAARIALARQRADATTRPLIERERLFRDAP